MLRALRALTGGRLICVLGAGGDRDSGKRPLMGAAAARGADLVVVTDDNPRSEDPAAIRAAMLAGAPACRPSAAEVVEIGDRRRGDRARRSRWARPGDVVLVAGKGHETGQEIAGVMLPVRRPRGAARALSADPGGGRVIALTLARIAARRRRHGCTTSAGSGPRVVTGTVEFDSRKVTPGGLFLALPGERVDGHDYAAAAVAAGAVAVLAARPVGVPAIVVPPSPYKHSTPTRWRSNTTPTAPGRGAHRARRPGPRLPTTRPADGLTVVGVTGSSGKTSTKDLLAAVLAPLGPTVAPPGSFNNELGHPWTVLRADEQTRYLVLELSARGRGHIARAGRGRAAAHRRGAQRRHRAPRRVRLARGDRRRPRASWSRRCRARRRRGGAQRRRPAGRGDGRAHRGPGRSRSAWPREADVRAADVGLDDARPRPRSRCARPAGEAPGRAAVHGEHQVGNALAAAAVALECGSSRDDGRRARCPRRGPRRPLADGGAPTAPTASPSSTTPTTPTRTRCAPRSRRSCRWRGRPTPRRSWAVLGEMARARGRSRAVEHDDIGRLAVAARRRAS